MPGAGSRAFYESRRQRREELSVMCGEGMRFPPHLHPELELFWLQSGSLYIDGREDSVILEAGDFAFFFPNDVHGYRSVGDNDRYRMAICSSPLLGDLLPTLTKHRPAQPFLRASRLHPDISYAMRRLCLDTPDGREVRRALLHLILARLLAEAREQLSRLPQLSPAQRSAGASLRHGPERIGYLPRLRLHKPAFVQPRLSKALSHHSPAIPRHAPETAERTGSGRKIRLTSLLWRKPSPAFTSKLPPAIIPKPSPASIPKPPPSAGGPERGKRAGLAGAGSIARKKPASLLRIGGSERDAGFVVFFMVSYRKPDEPRLWNRRGKHSVLPLAAAAGFLLRPPELSPAARRGKRVYQRAFFAP